MKTYRYLHDLRPALPVFVFLIVFVLVLMNITGSGFAAAPVANQNITPISSHLESENRFVPIENHLDESHKSANRKAKPWPSPFGIETNRSLTYDSLFSRADDLGVSWVRMNDRISWRELQPDPPDPSNLVFDINWTLLADFEEELIGMKERGLTPVVIVDDHPHWAVMPYKVGDEEVYSSCAAIKEEYFPAFANFVQKLVERYSDPKYNVHHWELGNEPDVDPRLVPVDNIFGCWGDPADPFFGGEHYGEMLKVVTPVIKAADPTAQVWLGGLMLDHPYTQPQDGSTGNFLAGIFEAGAAPYFDILPYHTYFGYYGHTTDWDNANIYDTKWYSWGGYLVGKATFLRQELARYGVDKPLFLNEFALNCPEHVTGCIQVADSFLQIQADQLVRSTSRGLANQISGFAWYTLDWPGWRNGSLLDDNQEPRPSYKAYQNLIRMLAGSKYRKIQNYGDQVEAYRFVRGEKYVDVLWAKEDQTHTITFRKTRFVEARDRDGGLLTLEEFRRKIQLEVGFSPIYLVFDRPRSHWK